VVGLLGTGWEGEVYLIRELATDIERTAKVFFPQRNQGNRVARQVAAKMYKLRDCPALLQYVTQETLIVQQLAVTVLISEFVEGDILSDFITSQRGRRLPLFEALHLMHALALALEPIHDLGEYHGDLHPGNVILMRRGIGFDVKLIDVHLVKQRKTWSIQDDVWDVVKIFYDAVGGSRVYGGLPQEVKDICKGLKRSLIAERFKNAGQLRRHLESFRWD
jgi:serine/threonine protein kinase